MPLRGTDRQPRLGGLRGVALLAVAALAASCASSGGPAAGREGLYHTVRHGETVYSISRRYGVSVESVLVANRIGDVHSIPTGAQLWIPADGRPPPRGDGPTPAASTGPPPAAREPLRPRGAPPLAWPLRGQLTSHFGRRHGRPHDGIDLAAKHGTPIRAAAPGKVIFAGRLGAYGRTVVIKHQGDYRTVYAHARQLYVRRGEFVEQGERIATVGTSGNATGPHLHFEVRYRDRPVDPLPFLP
jgi:murein DD-endopeptidase MepM/ murein hydrolase activator NlpD